MAEVPLEMVIFCVQAHGKVEKLVCSKKGEVREYDWTYVLTV